MKPADNSKMKIDQTNILRSSSLARFSSGASTSELGRGIFDSMKTPKEYEDEIESLRAMNTKLQIQLTKALEALALEHAEKIKARRAA